jgi:hypothetical protein
MFSAKENARLARMPKPGAVLATIQSDADAGRRVARIGAALDVFLTGGAVVALIGAGAWQALAADDFDKPAVTTFLLAIAAILAVTAFIVRRRRAAWPAKLSSRSKGLPSPGSEVSADETGLTVGSQVWLWADVGIDEVHVGSRAAGDGPTEYQIERLALDAAGAPLALDTFLMWGGQPVVDAVYWRGSSPVPGSG